MQVLRHGGQGRHERIAAPRNRAELLREQAELLPLELASARNGRGLLGVTVVTVTPRPQRLRQIEKSDIASTSSSTGRPRITSAIAKTWHEILPGVSGRACPFATPLHHTVSNARSSCSKEGVLRLIVGAFHIGFLHAGLPAAKMAAPDAARLVFLTIEFRDYYPP